MGWRKALWFVVLAAGEIDVTVAITGRAEIPSLV